MVDDVAKERLSVRGQDRVPAVGQCMEGSPVGWDQRLAEAAAAAAAGRGLTLGHAPGVAT